jgi:hypothetical protein
VALKLNDLRVLWRAVVPSRAWLVRANHAIVQAPGAHGRERNADVRDRYFR